MGLFKKSDKKKENKKMDDIKMDDINVGMKEQSEVNEEMDQIFGELDRCYAEVKQSIQRELCEYRDMLTRAKNQANIYKNKVQVRDVMEELLPILSEMRNDILQEGTADDLRKILLTRFTQMKVALKRVGIELLLHERNKPVDGSEKLNVSSIQPTSDCRLHQCVAFSNKMGCIIKGEEDNPILEDVALFQFGNVEKQEIVREKGTSRQGPGQQREENQHYLSIGSGQPVTKISKPDAEMIQNVNQERAIIPDFDIIDQTYIKLNKPISLCMQNWKGTLFAENDRIAVGIPRKRSIPYNLPYNARQNPMYLYLGSRLLAEDFRIYGSDVCYYLELDFAERKAILQLYYEQCDDYGRIQRDEYGGVKQILMKNIELIGR